MNPLDVPVAGGMLRAWRFGSHNASAPTVLAVHGITSSSRSWLAFGRALADRASVVAVDLRGRGRSNQLPGPYGMAAHAADLLAVMDFLELERAVAVGHSLGGYIVARLAADHPERVATAVLVDGGLTVPGSAGVDPQKFLDAFLGPAIARLRMTFADRDSHREWWRAHPALAPALASGELDDADLVEYADYDLIGEPPAMHSCISEDAVRTDGAELFEMGAAAHRLTVPAILMCAPRGLSDEPNPMQPLPVVEAWAAESPQTREAVLVPDVNHYTIAFGGRGAAMVAERVAACLSPARTPG